MTVIMAPDYLRCVHFHRNGRWLTCKAFPDRIPDAIIRGRKHLKRYPGDRGIRFELDPRAPPRPGPNDPIPVYRRNVRVDDD